jgi:hypothetical protein
LLCDGCEEHVLDLVYFFSGICVVYSAKSEFIMLSHLMLCLEYEVTVTCFQACELKAIKTDDLLLEFYAV